MGLAMIVVVLLNVDLWLGFGALGVLRVACSVNGVHFGTHRYNL